MTLETPFTFITDIDITLFCTRTQERRDHVTDMIERRKKEREIIKKSLPPLLKLPLEKFYFVDVQSLCDIKHLEDVEYLPCEVAITEYTLHSGSQRSFHQFIDPGVCGYSILECYLLLVYFCIETLYS